MLNVFLMNLGTGEGQWLNHLPLNDEEILSFIVDNEISTHLNEEYIIADYETEDFSISINEYSSIWELNQALNLYLELDTEQQLMVQAYMEFHSNSINGFFEALEMLDQIGFDSSIEDYSDLGYLLAEGLFSQKDSVIERYFDYEAYGRDYCLSGYADITSFGCLFY